MTIEDLKSKLDAALDFYQKELSALRTGRASPSLVENLQVSLEDNVNLPLKQVTSITVAEKGLLALNVWNKDYITYVEKAIIASNLGLNPVVSGQSIKIAIPPLSQERRESLCKLASQICEKAKISVRNIRKSSQDALKKEKSNIPEDDYYKQLSESQELIDNSIKKIDDLMKTKNKDIMSI